MSFFNSRLIKSLSRNKTINRDLNKTESKSIKQKIKNSVNNLSSSRDFKDYFGNFSIKTGVRTPVLPMVISIETESDIPKIVLLVNPNSMGISNTKKVNEQTSRYNINTEHAFDELSIMSISTSTGMFYTDDGISIENRTKSYSYDTFKKLVAIYRNNGAQYKNLSLYGSDSIEYIERMYPVKISYDNVEYFGSFDDFSVDESFDRPFEFTISFTFTIHSIDDSNSYGKESGISAFAARTSSRISSLTG